MRKCNKSLFSGGAVLIPRKGSLNNIMYVDETFWTVDTMFYATMKQPHTAVFVYFFVKAFDMYSMNIGCGSTQHDGKDSGCDGCGNSR